jgi:TPR repeat protein
VVNPEPKPIVQTAPNPNNNSAAASQLVIDGKKAMRAMNYQKAKKCFIEAAQQGNVEANYQLGMLYSNSNFDEYNKETATKHFTVAANSNHTEAMYQTGMMYLGTDNAEAKSWFRKAAAKGHSQAIKQLSRLR